ncbi:MAG: adenylate kinase [Dehalococcoidia bacterium]|nr:adenylate kinase [Dehalococcoidia bacterium]
MYVILLGAPGAGKGTQADILSTEMHLPHIAPGDLFRRALEEKTELGLLAKKYMEEGKLVPNEITSRMILERINQPACTFGCLFDGFPRTLEQAEVLDKALVDQGKNIDKAIYIYVPDEELVKRLSGRWICQSCQTPYHLISSPPKVPGKCDKCGGKLYQRPDDREETVRERLKVFFSQTMPLLERYRKQDKLIEINGNLGIQEVAKEILSVLKGSK